MATAAAILGSRAVGSAIGAIGGLATSALSNSVSMSNSKELMRLNAFLNYAYGKKTAIESPSWNRQGLEGAGYNPMLAVQNATSGVNSNFSGLGHAAEPNYNQAVSNAIDAVAAQNQTKQTDSTVDLNDATAENQRAEASNKRAQNPYISKQAEKDLLKTDAETAKLNSDTEYNAAAVKNMEQRIELEKYVAELDASSRRYSADKAYNATTYAADKSKEIADEHGPSGKSVSFKNYTSGVHDVLGGLAEVIHGVDNHNERNSKTEETTEKTIYDKKGNMRGSSYTRKVKGKRK